MQKWNYMTLRRRSIDVHASARHNNSLKIWSWSDRDLPDLDLNRDLKCDCDSWFFSHKTIFCNLDFDPWPSKSNHSSLASSTPKLSEIQSSNFQDIALTTKKCIFQHVGATVILNFNLLNETIDLLILVPKCTNAKTLVKISQMFFKILCQQSSGRTDRLTDSRTARKHNATGHNTFGRGIDILKWIHSCQSYRKNKSSMFCGPGCSS